METKELLKHGLQKVAEMIRVAEEEAREKVREEYRQKPKQGCKQTRGPAVVRPSAEELESL